MIERILEWSLKNRVMVIIASVLLVVGGLTAMLRLPIDAVPDVTNVQVQILTSCAGARAARRSSSSSRTPVEHGMSGLPRRRGDPLVVEVRPLRGHRRLRGGHRHLLRPPAGRRAPRRGAGGHPAGIRRARDGADLDRPRRDLPVRGRAASAQEPDGAAHDPRLGDRAAAPHRAGRRRGQLLRRRAQDVRGADPTRRPGAPTTSRSTRCFEALERNNANAGGGYIEQNGEQYLIRGEGLITSLDDIGDIVVATDDDGTPVYVRDVADVRPCRRWSARARSPATAAARSSPASS